MQRSLEIIPGLPRAQGSQVGTAVMAMTAYSFRTENEFSLKQATATVLLDIINSYPKGSPPDRQWNNWQLK